VPGLTTNGASADRLPHITNVSVPGVEQDALIVALDLAGIAVSVASACQSGAAQPSHVLAAMGRIMEGGASIRISVGRTTTEEEARRAATQIPAVVARVRAAA